MLDHPAIESSPSPPTPTLSLTMWHPHSSKMVLVLTFGLPWEWVSASLSGMLFYLLGYTWIQILSQTFTSAGEGEKEEREAMSSHPLSNYLDLLYYKCWGLNLENIEKNIFGAFYRGQSNNINV